MLYERYRDAMLRRHITRDGRLLQFTLLREDDAMPHNMRDTRETLAGQPYGLRASPVLLDGKLVAGGDNPMLYGGLAIATLAIEDMLAVSRHSYGVAQLMVQFCHDSLVDGLPWRQRHAWHPRRPPSKDELTGLLVGLSFFDQATRRRGSGTTVHHDVARAIAQRLRATQYSDADAWLFQFPFTRCFKFMLGSQYRAGQTFPDKWGVGDEIVEILALARSLGSFRWRYRPRDLYLDTMRLLPSLNCAAQRLGINPRVYNVALYLHAALLLLANPVNRRVKRDLWRALGEVSRQFRDNESFSRNSYLMLVSYLSSRAANASTQWVDEAFFSTPERFWQPHAPIRTLPRGHETRTFDGEARWGSDFIWSRSNYRLDWSWDKAQREIGADPQRLPDRQYYVEGVGLGLTFCHALGAYFDVLPVPRLAEDVAIPPVTKVAPQAHDRGAGT